MYFIGVNMKSKKSNKKDPKLDKKNGSNKKTLEDIRREEEEAYKKDLNALKQLRWDIYHQPYTQFNGECPDLRAYRKMTDIKETLTEPYKCDLETELLSGLINIEEYKEKLNSAYIKDEPKVNDIKDEPKENVKNIVDSYECFKNVETPINETIGEIFTQFGKLIQNKKINQLVKTLFE